MGSARYPHRTQRGPRMFIGGDGVWSATDCSGRFPATWSGHRRCCALPTSTSRDSSQVGTSSSRSTWYETVICANCARRQLFRVRQARQSPPATHAALRGPLQGLVHGDKSFVLDYGTRQDSVSIDRLKPAFVDPMTPIEAAKRAPRGRPPTGVETRSGRLVRPPELYTPR